jgi:hypothetical protein
VKCQKTVMKGTSHKVYIHFNSRWGMSNLTLLRRTANKALRMKALCQWSSSKAMNLSVRHNFSKLLGTAVQQWRHDSGHRQKRQNTNGDSHHVTSTHTYIPNNSVNILHISILNLQCRPRCKVRTFSLPTCCCPRCTVHSWTHLVYYKLKPEGKPSTDLWRRIAQEAKAHEGL